MPQTPVSVEVLIPIYRAELSACEAFSLEQCIQVLGHYEIFFVKPKGLNINHLIDKYKVKSKSQDARFFDGIAGYNRMMLSADFYASYQHVDYILIHQLDAVVFRDELMKFCSMQIDYIGAPWLSSPDSWYLKVSKMLQSKQKRQRQIIFGQVGNGGFSLRQTKKFHAVCREYLSIIENNLSRDASDIYYMEDVFWSLMAPELNRDFKVADFTQALTFAFDRKPEIAMKLNGGNLPFGCHGFNKPKVRKFWKKHLLQHFGQAPEFN